MSTQFTPGPWIAVPSRQKGRAAAAYYIDGQTGDLRCRAVAHVKNSPRLPVAANARLIAAAPDLLEALEEIINTEWIGGKGGFHRARAAIAKARGNA